MDWLEALRSEVALDWNRRLMQQPPGAACARCGVRNPLALVLPLRPAPGTSGRKRRIHCYRCRLMRLGRSGEEWHHVGGRLSPLPPVLIDANVHRVLTYLQRFWRRRGARPGTAQAVVFDLVMLLIVGMNWAQAVRP